MHSSRMRTTHPLPWGGLPLDRDPPPWTETPPGQRLPPWTEDPPVNRITDKCKNITFPQLSLWVVKSWHQNNSSMRKLIPTPEAHVLVTET